MSPPPTPQAPGLGGNPSSKKKKKKKGKGKAVDEYATPLFEEYDVEEDDTHPYDAAEDGARLELHPDLQPIPYPGGEYLPSNTPLSQSAAAAARLNATAAAQAELLATANDLYRRMDADPQGGIADDDEYWASLPAHIRNFVRPPPRPSTHAGR